MNGAPRRTGALPFSPHVLRILPKPFGLGGHSHFTLDVQRGIFRELGCYATTRLAHIRDGSYTLAAMLAYTQKPHVVFGQKAGRY